MRVAAGLTLGLAALAGAALALADESEPPILHEYVAPPAGPGGQARIIDPQADPKVIDKKPGDAKANPTAFRQADKILPEPSAKAKPGAREPVFGADTFGADRETEARPDRVTQADDTLEYTEVYNPSVAPFKRMSALDAVDADYTLHVWRADRAELEVGGQTSPERDLFWGSMSIAFRPGADIPIPSVAPDMRILSWEVEPALGHVAFAKDGADNYFVRSDDPTAAGTHRLVFLCDAPASYFAATIPRGRTIAQATAGGPGVAPMPAPVRAAAEVTMNHIGLWRGMALDVAVDRLVAYFRAFQAGDPPPDSGDIYRDLCLSQRGVCRHRSFAFVITANALGIPARYVTNEAHAFGELWLPDVGWVRVDLGGSASTLDIHNAQDKAMHRPRGEDPFPRPPEYADNYTRLRGDVRGLSPDQIEEARTPLDPGGGGNGGGSANDPLSPAPGRGLPQPPPGAFAGKTETTIAVSTVDAVGFRGESVRVSGRLESGGRGVGGLRVDLYLAPAGAGGDGARFVGQTVTEADGRFSAAIDLPADLPLGKQEVFASSPGDSKYAPVVSP